MRADMAPAAVHAPLLDEGRYLGSVRTMSRLLAAHGGCRASVATSSPIRWLTTITLAGRVASRRNRFLFEKLGLPKH